MWDKLDVDWQPQANSGALWENETRNRLLQAVLLEVHGHDKKQTQK